MNEIIKKIVITAINVKCIFRIRMKYFQFVHSTGYFRVCHHALTLTKTISNSYYIKLWRKKNCWSLAKRHNCGDFWVVLHLFFCSFSVSVSFSIFTLSFALFLALWQRVGTKKQRTQMDMTIDCKSGRCTTMNNIFSWPFILYSIWARLCVHIKI